MLKGRPTYRTLNGCLRLPWAYVTDVRPPTHTLILPALSPGLLLQKHFTINLCALLTISEAASPGEERIKQPLKSVLDHSPVIFLALVSCLYRAVLSPPCQSASISMLLIEMSSAQLSSPILGILPNTPGILFVGAGAHWVIIIFRKNVLWQGELGSGYLCHLCSAISRQQGAGWVNFCLSNMRLATFASQVYWINNLIGLNCQLFNPFQHILVYPRLR